MRYLSYLPILVILSSCSSRTDEPTHSFRIYEEDGVTIAETTGGPKYEGELFEYEELFRLQQDEAHPESLLNRPFGFSMGDDSSFFILDGADKRVVVYSSDGRYSHSIGRPGDGPGEFRGPRYLTVYQDTVSVFDGSLQRVSLFNKDGAFIATASAPNLPPSILTLHIGPNRERICFLRKLVHIPQDPDPYSIQSILIFSSAGDTIAAFETPMVQDGEPQAEYVPGRGIFTTVGKEPWIKWFNLRGNLIRIIRMQTSWKSDIAQKQLFWSVIIVEENGTLWAKMPSDPTGQDPVKPEYRVFSAPGEYIGNTECPDIAWNFSHGHLLAFSGYPSDIIPIVYRIRPTVEGLKYP